MVYAVELKPRAVKDIRNLPEKDARRVYEGLRQLEDGLIGDVKKLTRHHPVYRLRIGNWRVLFDIEEDRIVVYRVRHRRESYR